MEKLEVLVKELCGQEIEDNEAGRRFQSVIVQDYVGSLKSNGGRLGSCNISSDDVNIADLPPLKKITKEITSD